MLRVTWVFLRLSPRASNSLSINIVEIMYFYLLYRLIIGRIPFRSVGARRFGKFSIVVNFNRCPRVTSKCILLKISGHLQCTSCCFDARFWVGLQCILRLRDHARSVMFFLRGSQCQGKTYVSVADVGNSGWTIFNNISTYREIEVMV